MNALTSYAEAQASMRVTEAQRDEQRLAEQRAHRARTEDRREANRERSQESGRGDNVDRYA